MAKTNTYDIININSRPPMLSDMGFWGDVRFDATEVTPDYIGLHKLRDAATTASDWKIYKFTYTGTAANRIELAYGAWDDRATLFP